MIVHSLTHELSNSTTEYNTELRFYNHKVLMVQELLLVQLLGFNLAIIEMIKQSHLQQNNGIYNIVILWHK